MIEISEFSVVWSTDNNTFPDKLTIIARFETEYTFAVLNEMLASDDVTAYGWEAIDDFYKLADMFKWLLCFGEDLDKLPTGLDLFYLVKSLEEPVQPGKYYVFVLKKWKSKSKLTVSVHGIESVENKQSITTKCVEEAEMALTRYTVEGAGCSLLNSGR